MPNVVREDLDNLNALLTVTIPRQELEPKVNSELTKFRKKANLKGFRKGKVPLGFVKKMYGQSIMMNVVNEAIEKELSDYITNEKVEILGQPIPTKDQGQVDLNINSKEDLIFKFDLGLAPSFEVKGVDDKTTMEKYAVQVPAEMIDEDLAAARKRLGTREPVEDEIKAGDMISINANEMDGDAMKLDGWATTFSILFDDVTEGATKDELSTLSKGDKFVFNIFQIEKDNTPENVRKYLLNVQENDGDVEIGEEFEGVIGEVTRAMPCEMNQEFYDKYFGEGKVSSEQEARDLISQDLGKYFDQQAEGLLFRDIQESLLEKNPLDLPDEFLKRWLMTSSKENTPEIIEKGYEGFAKNLQWTLIRGKLAGQYEVKVSQEEVFAKIRAQIMQYYGMYMDEAMVNNMVQRMAQDQQQVERIYEDILVDKIFKKVKENVNITEKSIEKDAFEKIITEAREKVAAAQLAAEIGEEVAGEEEE